MQREANDSAQISPFAVALSRLCDSETDLLRFEFHALSGPTRAEVALFGERWPNVPVEHRRRVIQALVERAEASFELDFFALFRYCLDDEDPIVRCQAIEGLWECDDVTLVQPLVKMLRHDPIEEVRAAAAIGLSPFALLAELEELDTRRSKLVFEALLETIRDPAETVEVRRRAVEAIAYMAVEGVREIIEAAYNDDDERMRISAVFAMGRSADAYWSDTVLSELSAPDPEMRYEAAHACGELKLRKAVPRLCQFINDPDRNVQEAAVWALGQIGGAQAKRALERCLQSGDEVLEAAAEDALGELALGRIPLMLLSYDMDDEDLEDDEDIEDWDETDFEELGEEDWI